MNKKVAIYIRVSTPQQAEWGYSLAMQEGALRLHCNSRGDSVVAVYKDAGLSAKDVKGRPALKQLLADMRTNQFDTVLVWKLSRFTRNLSDLCTTCDEMEKHGCYLESYTESFDARVPVGRMIRGILGVVAQWEREVIAENVKAAMEERAKEGKPTSFCVLGYDYVKGRGLVINEAEAENVRILHRLYQESGRFTVVRGIANKLGIRGKRGAELDAWSIEQILTRAIYCGYSSFHGMTYKSDHDSTLQRADFLCIKRV